MIDSGDPTREPEQKPGFFQNLIVDTLLMPVFEILGLIVMGVMRITVYLIMMVLGAIASVFSV